jgi:hypothetical protein
LVQLALEESMSDAGVDDPEALEAATKLCVRCVQ